LLAAFILRQEDYKNTKRTKKEELLKLNKDWDVVLFLMKGKEINKIKLIKTMNSTVLFYILNQISSN